MQDILRLNLYKTPTTQFQHNSNQIFIKREDLIPFSFGGNKVRIALELLEDMYSKGLNCMVGYGNARSNLSRALANICFQKNIPCHIISPADDNGSRIETFNSTIVQSCNAVFHYCDKNNVRETVEKVLKMLIDQGLKPYYIYGNSLGKGNEHIPLKAYRKVYHELTNQYDYIFLATGTGMTQGGLLVGKALEHGKEKIVGISIARTALTEKDILKRMITAYSVRVEKVDIVDDDIIVDDAYLSGGYGQYNSEIEATIQEQMTQNGIPLDPTYTGKAFWGMLNYLEKNNINHKKILFIHTGGTPLFFDYKRGIKIHEFHNENVIYEAVIKFESNLSPSLVERNVDLVAYAKKIAHYGMAWGHFDSGVPVSLIAGYFNDNIEFTAYLTFLTVDINYRGKGFASALLLQVEEYAKTCGMKNIKLEVRTNNDKAQQLYKKMGYYIVGKASEISYYMMKKLY